MSNLNSHDSKFKEQNAEHFAQLVNIAMANRVITSIEKELLYRMGKKLGFTVHEADSIIEKVFWADYTPPEILSKRFEQAYDIVRMTLVDGGIDKDEMRLVSKFIAKIGFNEREIPNLILVLLRGIRQKKKVEELIEIYLKTR